MLRSVSCLSVTLLAWLSAVQAASAVEPNEDQLKALRPFAGVVGEWKGEGNSLKVARYEETGEVYWGFRDKDGRASLDFFMEGGWPFEIGQLTYDPEMKVYKFLGVSSKSKKRYRFAGKPEGAQTLRLLRTDKDAKDKYDRLEIKL